MVWWVFDILAADVSTLGGIALPGFNRLDPLEYDCWLYGILSKAVFDSSGGVARWTISIDRPFTSWTQKLTFASRRRAWAKMLPHHSNLNIPRATRTFYGWQKTRRSHKVCHDVQDDFLIMATSQYPRLVIKYWSCSGYVILCWTLIPSPINEVEAVKRSGEREWKKDRVISEG